MRNAENEAAYDRKRLVTHKQKHQQLKSELECLAGLVNKSVYDFEVSKKDIDIIVQRIKTVTASSKSLQNERKIIRNQSEKKANVTHLALQSVTNWKVSVDNEHSFTTEKIIADAREKVELLRDKRDALVNAPQGVESLHKSLDDHHIEARCLEKEVSAAIHMC